MMIFGKKIGPAAAITCALALACGGALASRAHALTPSVGLASHRAVYELTLAQSAHGNNSSTVSARGRILYDFTGSACEGYKLEFRQVSELDNGEGKVVAQRPAFEHLGGRRRQELSFPSRKTT